MQVVSGLSQSSLGRPLGGGRWEMGCRGLVGKRVKCKWSLQADSTPRKLGRKDGELQEFESLWLLLLFFKY